MDWPEPIQWFINNFEKIKAFFDKIFDVWDSVMAFLDKLKDGGYSLIQWIWTNIKHKVAGIVGDTLSKVFGGLFDKLKDVVLAPIHALQNAITSFYQHLMSYTSSLPAPLQILVVISIAGAATAGLIWVLKRLYELL